MNGGGEARVARVARAEEVPDALDGLDLGASRPVLVLVGGAGGMDDAALAALAGVMRDVVVPAVERHGATVVDGGTDAGVMRSIGQARHAAGARFPLLGVAAEGTVIVPGAAADPGSDRAELEAHHTHFLLVPGAEWGDEAPWIPDVAGVLAGSRPSVTVLVNGGQIAYTDVTGSLAARRPVLVLAGSGRTADAIAGARAGRAADPRAVEIAASPLTVTAGLDDPAAIATALDRVLGGAG